MALFTEDQVRQFAQPRLQKSLASANRLLKIDESAASNTAGFDVFLSHSFKDADIVLGIKSLLEGAGLIVYVDWLVDGGLDRSNVTAATAEHLRSRMKQSKTLIYAHSMHSPDSKWMPWELGFFDGFNGAIAVLPITKSADEKFPQQEFLGLYPYIDTVQGNAMFVNKGRAPDSTLGYKGATSSYLGLKEWIDVRGRAR
jgi:hypothetical protein